MRLKPFFNLHHTYQVFYGQNWLNYINARIIITIFLYFAVPKRSYFPCVFILCRCRHCNKAFTTQSYQTRHEKTHPEDPRPQNKPWECQFCGKHFMHVCIHSRILVDGEARTWGIFSYVI